MLYRFRESQAVEMGLGGRVKGERRPRMASAVSSLRECERWRGDIMRDVSRKVSKIQDGGLKLLLFASSVLDYWLSNQGILIR